MPVRDSGLFIVSFGKDSGIYNYTGINVYVCMVCKCIERRWTAEGQWRGGEDGKHWRVLSFEQWRVLDIVHWSRAALETGSIGTGTRVGSMYVCM